MVSYDLCWKLECWLDIVTTRANRVCKSFSFFLSVCQLNCLRTSKGLNLGEGYTSPSYLLFQTLLPLFSTLTCIIWMELTGLTMFSAELPWCCFMCRKQIFSEWPETPQNILEKIIKNPRARPPTSWVPWKPSDANSNSIYLLSERKYQREEIIAFYDTEPPPSPKTSREGWSGVHSGLRRGAFVAVVIINHPPSPISWCSLPCVSNSIVGLLDGEGLDEIYHVIELVLLGFDP